MALVFVLNNVDILNDGESFVFRFALGIVSYGISFGIQSLSGNIYLNLFLFSLVGIPSKSIALWLQNRYVTVSLILLKSCS